MTELVLNDLSVPADECTQAVAVERLKHLVGALRGISNTDPGFTLSGPHALVDLTFGANWPLAVLRNSAQCVDENIYIKTIQDRFPYSKAVAEVGGPAIEEVDYRLRANAPIFPDGQALGLGLAHQFNGIALSVRSHPFWHQSQIELTRSSLNESGNIAQEDVDCRNVCCLNDVAFHADAIIAAATPNVNSGVELWARREVLFPHLRFIPRTRPQLEALLQGDPVFEAVLTRLVELDKAVRHWRENHLARPPYSFSVTKESRTRLALVAFPDDAGTVHSFSDHAKFGPIEGRLHFVLVSGVDGFALIGHVGRKLGIG
ncbi:MAG: hypothetical protein E5W97_30295 [Mesorhizobium sp.]|nr:MAG: hypothetical protein E5W97_30295 [Mesorhizobium sp.]